MRTLLQVECCTLPVAGCKLLFVLTQWHFWATCRCLPLLLLLLVLLLPDAWLSFSNEMRLQMQFYIFQKSILSVDDRPERRHRHNSDQTKPEQQHVTCHCVNVCVLCLFCVCVFLLPIRSSHAQTRETSACLHLVEISVCTKMNTICLTSRCWKYTALPHGVLLYRKRLCFRLFTRTSAIALSHFRFLVFLVSCCNVLFVAHGVWVMFFKLLRSLVYLPRIVLVFEQWLWIDCQMLLLLFVALFFHLLWMLHVSLGQILSAAIWVSYSTETSPIK